MIVEDQSELIAFLSSPAAFGGPVERIETHISEIFLVGERAFKLKRAVRFPYLDFSTAALRRQACEAEVRINRRTAPDLYRGVVPVTRRHGAFAVGGDGPALDWLVEMRRFDQDTLFDRLAQQGRLERRLMEDAAEAIARFHDGAAPSPAFGGRQGMAAILDSNRRCFAEAGAGIFDADAVRRLDDATRAALVAIADRLEERRRGGRVRHCHGDLHLRNIFLADGRPVLFDAIEFNDAIAHIDVIYDLAFLLMDLEYRGLRGLAGVVLNRYLDVTWDTGGLALLPLFLSTRAAIRAHVGAAAAKTLGDARQAAAQAEEARAYLAMALGYLEPAPPRLVAVGGLSGSGKSRTARAIAPFIGAAPGARILRTDVIRKRLAGVGTFDRLGPDAYSPTMTKRTYGGLYDEALATLRTGHSVVADAVFARPEQREAIAAVADRATVPFDALWLEAPPAVMQARASKRGRDASDADAGVVALQRTYDLGEVGWKRLDSSGAKEETVRLARALLGLRRAPGRVV